MWRKLGILAIVTTVLFRRDRKIDKSMPQAPDDAKQASLYLELYKEQCAHGRHVEAQRQTVSAMLLTAAGALTGLIGAMRFALGMLPVTVCIVALGCFGRSFISAYTIKWDQLSERRNFYRGELVKCGKLESPTGDFTGKGTLRVRWRTMFCGVIVVGLICASIVVALPIARFNRVTSDAIFLKLSCIYSKLISNKTIV